MIKILRIHNIDNKWKIKIKILNKKDIYKLIKDMTEFVSLFCCVVSIITLPR